MRKGFNEMSKTKNIWLSVGIVFISLLACFILAEVIARVTHHGPKGVWHLSEPRYRELTKGLPGIEEHWDNLKKVTENGLMYYDYHLFAIAPIRTSTITIDKFYSSRDVPSSVDLIQADERIWLFGGSTLQNLGAPDSMTTANYMTKQLADNGIKANVRNLAVSMFQTSLELAKFQDLLRSVPADQRPTHAVFVDGFNDGWYGYRQGAGSMEYGISQQIADLITGKFSSASLMLAFTGVMQDNFVFWRRWIHPHIMESIYTHPDKKKVWRINRTRGLNDQNVIQTIENHYQNYAMIQSICRTYSVQCHFALQPMIFTKKTLTPIEQEVFNEQDPKLLEFYKLYYQNIFNKLQTHPYFVNLTGVFDASPNPDFYDIGHVLPESNERLGRTLGQYLAEKIKVADLPVADTNASIQAEKTSEVSSEESGSVKE